MRNALARYVLVGCVVTSLLSVPDAEKFSWEENLSGSSGLTVPKPSNTLPADDKVTLCQGAAYALHIVKNVVCQ